MPCLNFQSLWTLYYCLLSVLVYPATHGSSSAKRDICRRYGVMSHGGNIMAN
ncbi:hypothetical protein BJX64DRAFT_269262 [Aspergillus heterothallicus]